MEGIKNLDISWSFVSTKLSQIEANQRLANSFVDLRHYGDNHTYLTKSKAKGLLDIPLVNTQISQKFVMAPNQSNITASRTGTTSETTFHIYLCTNVPIYTSQKTKNNLIGKYWKYFLIPEE